MHSRRALFVLAALSVTGLLFSGVLNFSFTQADADKYVARVKANAFCGALKNRDAVPDERTAIALAMSIWKPIYGTDSVGKDERRYGAFRVGDCWFVTAMERSFPDGPKAVIVAKDGRLLCVSAGIE